MNDIEWLLANGYVVAGFDLELLLQCGLDGMDDRVAHIDAKFMIFDPIDDADGYIICGDDLASLAEVARKHLDVA